MQTKDYIPYKIKSRDTLTSLANRIGLDDYKDLLNFHNKICSKTEYLKIEELTKGNTLYIPDTQKVDLINKHAKKENITETIKPFRLQLNQLNALYYVEIVKKNITGKNKKENFISYKIDINFIESDESSNILCISKSNFKVNKKEPQTKMQQLALQCSKSFYPINLILNKNGKIIGIENIKKIQERWLKNKIEIKQSFTGFYADKYIEDIDYKIFNTNQLEEIIINDTMINSLLIPYKRLNVDQETVFHSIFLKHKINYKVTQNIEKHETTKNRITIMQEGLVDDTRSYKEILKPDASIDNPYFIKSTKIEGELKNILIIDIQRGIPEKIKAMFKVNYTPNKNKVTTININLIK